MKLVLASDNKNKLREFRTLFENFGVELISKAESGFTEEVEETGETFAENARIKAEAVMRATGLAAIADDSGLCVDALGGAPGVHSARYTGNHADSDADRYNLLLRNSAGEMTARRGLSARSAALSRTATYLPPRGRARERSFLRPAARTASAMIRFSARTDLTAPWRS